MATPFCIHAWKLSLYSLLAANLDQFRFAHANSSDKDVGAKYQGGYDQ